MRGRRVLRGCGLDGVASFKMLIAVFQFNQYLNLIVLCTGFALLRCVRSMLYCFVSLCWVVGYEDGAGFVCMTCAGVKR